MSQLPVTVVHMFATAAAQCRPHDPTRVAGSRHLGVVACEHVGTYAAGDDPSAGALAEKLSRLHTELVAVADDVPERAPAAEVDALFAAFRRVQGAVATVGAKLVRCAQVSRAPEESGHAGAPSYLKEQLGLSSKDAAKQEKLARDLERLPDTAAALAAGELGPDQAAAIGHAAQRGALGSPEQTEEQLLDIARSTDADGLRRRIREEEQRADRERLEKDERLAHSRRRASLTRRADGMWDLHAQLTGEFGEMLAVALDAHRTKDAPDVPVPQQRSFEQRTADALAAFVAGAMEGGNQVTQGGARPQLHLVIPHDILDADGAGVARTERGNPVSSALVERLLCDAQMRRVLTDGHSEVLELGRLREKWTVGQRRALHVRDGGCRGPGCDRPPTSCHAHHVHWWSKGGNTDVRNGLLLCSYHHHLVHEGGWGLQVDGRSGRAVFTAPGGQQLLTEPKGLPATPRTVRDPAGADFGSPRGDAVEPDGKPQLGAALSPTEGLASPADLASPEGLASPANLASQVAESTAQADVAGQPVDGRQPDRDGPPASCEQVELGFDTPTPGADGPAEGRDPPGRAPP